jgi:hypothetical protein
VVLISSLHQPLEYIVIPPLSVSAQSALQFYNQNKKQILNIVMPIVQDTAEEVMTQIGNRILSTVPLNELLPAWAAICDCLQSLQNQTAGNVTPTSSSNSQALTALSGVN